METSSNWWENKVKTVKWNGYQMKVGDLKTIMWPQPSSKGTMKYFLSSPSKVKGYFDWDPIKSLRSLSINEIMEEVKTYNSLNIFPKKKEDNVVTNWKRPLIMISIPFLKSDVFTKFENKFGLSS